MEKKDMYTTDNNCQQSKLHNSEEFYKQKATATLAKTNMLLMKA